MNLSQFYINGKWVDPIKPGTLNIINPATEESVGRLSMGSAEDVDNAVVAARNAFQSFAKTSVHERLELLTEIRNILSDCESVSVQIAKCIFNSAQILKN